MDTPPDLGAAFERYAPQLRRYIAQAVAADDVEDVLSATFLDAWRNLDRYEERGYALSAWLYGIARSRILDQRRRYVRNRSLPLLPEIAQISGPEDATLRSVYHGWVRERILCDLRGDQRRVIWLRYVEDLELKEVARRLDLSVGAVKALQVRGIANLRQAIAPDDMPSMMAAFADATPERPRCQHPGCQWRARDGGAFCVEHRRLLRQPFCQEPGCTRRVRDGGDLCGQHRRRSTRVLAKSQRCRAPGCTEQAQLSDGFCAKHHARAVRRGGDTADRVLNRDRVCAATGCDRAAARGGRCIAHYGQELRRRQGKQTTKPCRAPGCERARHARGLCIMHFEERRQSDPTPR